jgi:hypothetical protein
MPEVQIAIIDQQDTQVAVAVPGVQGAAGPGVAAGGNANEVLFKQSSTNYDTAWGSITSAMIGDLSVTNADIASNAAIAYSKLATLTAGNIVLGNASNVATSTAVTGDVTISSSGVTAIAAEVIVNANVNASAAIAGTKISPNFGSQNITTTGNITFGVNSAPAVKTDTTGVTGADQVTNIISLTQAEYNAIVSPDSATFYVITI